MNYKLALFALATLFLTTESIRCYNCMEVSYTIADKKYNIPNEVKCDKNSTYACETNMTACSNVKYKFGLTFTGVAGSAEGVMKGCSPTVDMTGVCDVAEMGLKESLKSLNIVVDDFDCSAESCKDRDYCNTADSAMISLVMVTLLATVQLFA